MIHAQSFEDFLLYASEAHQKNNDGILFISQRDFGNRDLFLGDEDTGNQNIPQEILMLLRTDGGSAYFEYTFIQPQDLEDVHEQLLEIYELYPREVVDREEIKNMLG